MITLSGNDLIELLDFVSPDTKRNTEQLTTEVALIRKHEPFMSLDGKLQPSGLYAYLSEYPEQGLHGPLGFVRPGSMNEQHARQCLHHVTSKDELTDAARDVLAERQRQMDGEGWTHEHDDGYDSFQLAAAASSYVANVVSRAWIYVASPDNYRQGSVPDEWPADWDDAFYKPKDPRGDLVKAAALLLAEIERIDRVSVSKEQV